MTALMQMTDLEFRALLEDVVEKKLLELLGDPDSGLEIRAALRARLERQQQMVAAGERGFSLDEVRQQLGL